MRVIFQLIIQYVYFLQVFIDLDSQTLMDGREISKLEFMYAILARRFIIWYFLALLWVNRSVFLSSSFILILATLFPCCLSIQTFSYVIYLPIGCIKMFCLSCIQLWLYLDTFPTTFSNNFISFFFSNILFYLYCLTVSGYIFNIPSFASTFVFISARFIVLLCSLLPDIFWRFFFFSVLIFLLVVESFFFVIPV